MILKGRIELRWKHEEEARLRMGDCVWVRRLHFGDRETGERKEGKEGREEVGRLIGVKKET